MLAHKSLTLLSRLGLCRRPSPTGGLLGDGSDEGEEAAGERCRPQSRPRSRSGHGRPGTSRASHSSSQVSVLTAGVGGTACAQLPRMQGHFCAWVIYFCSGLLGCQSSSCS